VTIASRPSVGRDGGGYAGDLGRKGTRIFLRRGLDDPNHPDSIGVSVLNAHDPDAAFTGPFKTNSFIATSSAMQRQHCGQLGR
jgi:hypothetical protein